MLDSTPDSATSATDLTTGKPRPRRRRWLRALLGFLAVLAVAAAVAALWVRHELHASLARLDGEISLDAGALGAVTLSAPVQIERDGLGVPTLRAANRSDLAVATGFLHAQERFFQMDLMRRQSAGELSALFGAAALPPDRDARVHRFRARARASVAAASPEERGLLEAYAAGVNAGLADLGTKPFEYLMVRREPTAWVAEDSLLVALAMYFVLQDSMGRPESALGLVHDLLPPELAAFLMTRGTEWDAPLVGEPFAMPPIPGPEVWDLRSLGKAAAKDRSDELADATSAVLGSNNFAVAGNRTSSGAALVANDMHLPLGVPNTWYRASFLVAGPDGAETRVTGVTLPGIPLIVVGSNGHVAWGFTNSYGDWSDLVVLEQEEGDALRYRTPDGFRAMERIEEVIEVAGGPSETLEVFETIWGPVIDQDHQGRRRVLRWVAHDPQATNLALIGLETAPDVEAALAVAHAAGLPAQNFVVGDAAGRIGWTIVGPVPRRVGFDGRVPTSWSEAGHGWDGYLAPEEVPVVRDPEAGYLWSANNRTTDGAMLALLGDGGYDLGARARQIRDGLASIEGPAVPADMLRIQLDDRELMVARWRDLLLSVLSPEWMGDDPLRKQAREILETGWNGHSSPESVAFRMARSFRIEMERRVYEGLTASLEAADERFNWGRLTQREGPLWSLVTQRPPHLLDPQYGSWEEALQGAADTVLKRIASFGPLAEQTWGNLNAPRVQHPLSQAVPQLAGFLDIETPQLPGSDFVPRAQGVRFGASERLALSPGRESEGYFHMPCGQSGHPLSPFYRAGHQAWVEATPTPFLPGETEHTLVLLPAS